jgi:hypothetical protein
VLAQTYPRARRAATITRRCGSAAWRSSATTMTHRHVTSPRAQAPWHIRKRTAPEDVVSDPIAEVDTNSPALPVAQFVAPDEPFQPSDEPFQPSDEGSAEPPVEAEASSECRAADVRA